MTLKTPLNLTIIVRDNPDRDVETAIFHDLDTVQDATKTYLDFQAKMRQRQASVSYGSLKDAMGQSVGSIAYNGRLWSENTPTAQRH